MILETHPFWQDDLRLEIVNGLDIMKTYEDITYVASCQSIDENAYMTEMFAHVPGMNLIRVMNSDDEVMLRAALWHTTTGEKFIGPIYTQRNYNGVHSRPGILEAFLDVYHKYGDINIGTEQYYVATTLKNYNGPWPTVDIFRFMNMEKTLLSNQHFGKGVECYVLSDYDYGELSSYCP